MISIVKPPIQIKETERTVYVEDTTKVDELEDQIKR